MGTSQEARLQRAEDHARFADRLRRLEKTREVWRGFFHRDEETGLCDHALYKGQWQEIADAWRARFPRRRKVVAEETTKAWNAVRRTADAGEFPELEAIHEGYEALARELGKKLDEEQTVLRDELTRMALGLEVPKGFLWTQIGVTHMSAYSSQGLGAEKYARGAAEEIADKARAYGLEVRILRVEDHRYQEYHWRGWSMGERISYRFEVEALTTPTGAEILDYKPALSLREQVKACWARRVNPRVYWPMLPPDWEEENGLDYFGGEVAKERESA